MKRLDILYFSSDEWESGLKTSQYHVAKHLSNSCFVLYINSIGLRKPDASKRDFLKVLKKLSNFLRGARRINDNLYVVSPIVIPFHSNRVIAKINRYIMFLFIEYYKNKFHLHRKPVIITFIPNIVGYLELLSHSKVIYYCADQVSNFIGVDIEEVQKQENELIRKSDIVFTTSLTLYNEKKTRNKNTCYIPHGVDVKLFEKALNKNLPIPADMKSLKKPIIGFFGLISKDWIDFDLLKYVAESHPEWSIVLLGKSESNIPDITSFTNIYLLGTKDYERLPNYCCCFDVGIIPFVVSELTKNCNPIKVKEYLAAGLPVVSTEIPELKQYDGIISVAHNHNQFVNCIEKAISNKGGGHREKRKQYVLGEAWEKKVRNILELLLNQKGIECE